MYRIYARCCILRHGEMYNWYDFKYEMKHHFNILESKVKSFMKQVLYDLKIDSRTKHNDTGQMKSRTLCPYLKLQMRKSDHMGHTEACTWKQVTEAGPVKASGSGSLNFKSSMWIGSLE